MVGPLITNMNGEIILNKAIVDKEIVLNKKEFPMDYDGGLIDCDLLSVIIESKSNLEERVKRLVKYYPDNANVLLGLLKNTANSEVNFREDISLPTYEEVISISLCSKGIIS